MDNVDFTMCPIGIRNEKEIEHTRDRFDLAMQRLEEKMDDMKNDISSMSTNVNDQLNDINKKFDNKFDKLEKKFDILQSSLPQTIDSRIQHHSSTQILTVVKWIIITLGGSLTITIVTRLILRMLGL